MHRAPIVESGDTSTRCPPMFIDIAMPVALAPGSCGGQARHQRQERRQDDAGRAAVDRHDPGQQGDDAGHRAGRGDPGHERHHEIDALKPLDERDEHGHARDHDDHAPRHQLDRLAIVRHAGSDEQHGGDERRQPDVRAEHEHADEERGDHAEGDPVAPVERAGALGIDDLAPCGRRQTGGDRRRARSRRTPSARARRGCRGTPRSRGPPSGSSP